MFDLEFAVVVVVSDFGFHVAAGAGVAGSLAELSIPPLEVPGPAPAQPHKPLPRPPSTTGLRLGTAPVVRHRSGVGFVGRDADLTWIHDALADPAAATGVALWGPPGIGRTRLFREASARLAIGAFVVSAQLPAHPRSEVGYSGLAEMVGPLSQLAPGDELLRTGKAASDTWAAGGLRLVFSKDPVKPTVTSAAMRRAACAALRWAAERAVERAAGATVVLVVDDVDSLDGASLLALADLLADEPLPRFKVLMSMVEAPEVYILILPAWGFVSDFVSFFSRKPAYWYKGSVYAMVVVCVLSALVYGHHMFVTGMSPLLGQGFMLLTLFISVPAEVLFLNWLHTIWKGSIRLTSPMLFALGTVFVFGLGGLTGIFLGTISTDLYLHDTMYVVGHFHFTMAAAAFLGSFGAIYFWFPKMFGRQMNETLAKAHFWPSVIGITLVFGGQLIAGYSGQQRRLFDPYQYTFLQHLHGLNRFTSLSAFALGVAQLLFLYNFVASIFTGKKAEKNPWQVGTLEWDLPSPPPHHNFDVVPTVLRGPHEFANPEGLKAFGRDWLSQTEEMPAATAAVVEKPAVGA